MSRQNGTTGGPVEADLAQAFKELARGESTATALENHLDSLEKKIEEMLAKAEEEEKNRQPQSTPSGSSQSNEDKPAA